MPLGRGGRIKTEMHCGWMVKDTEQERESSSAHPPGLAKALLASSAFKPGYNNWWVITARAASLTPTGAWVMWSGVHNSMKMKQLDEREKVGMKHWLTATKKQQRALQARDEIFAILPGPWAAGLHSIYMEMSLSLLRWGWREREGEKEGRRGVRSELVTVLFLHLSFKRILEYEILEHSQCI